MLRKRDARFKKRAAILVGFTVILTVLLARGQGADRAVAVGEYRAFLPAIVVSLPGTPMPIARPAPPFGSVQESTRLGVWLDERERDLNAKVELLKKTGATWTRVNLVWSRVEPIRTEPPTYHFDTYDRVFDALLAIGVTPIVGIMANPSWAATSSCGPPDKPGGIDAFGDLLRAAVSRFGRAPYNLEHWELYNEPDNRDLTWGSFLGGCFGDTPGKYLSVLQTAYAAIKQADPDAKILIGGLAQAQYVDPEKGSIFNPEFLSQVLALGGGSYFDIANIHYYSSESASWPDYGSDITGKVEAVRQTMARHGVDKPVVVTESSWTSSPAASPDTPERQAQYVPKVLARSLAIDLYALIWFTLSDWRGTDYPYGLATQTLQPRPSYYAFQTAVNELGGATFTRQLSPAEVGAEDGVEGYVFYVGGQERWVLWVENPSSLQACSPIQLHLPNSAIEARDKFGLGISLSNNDGPTFIALDCNPIYVHLTPS